MQQDPARGLHDLIIGKWVSQSISVAATLGVADQLADGPKSIEVLAKDVEADPRSLYRLMRALSVVGIFAETPDGRFEQTPMSACLQSDAPGSWRPFAVFMGSNFSWRSWGDLLYSVKSSKPAFNHVYGKPLFEYLAESPPERSVFDAVMVDITRNLSAAVVASYDFSAVHHVVDVGGGHGALLKAILRTNPAARGTLFDLPEVVSGVEESSGESGIADRFEIVPGDMFESVPRNGDLYILSRVIHDWDDDRALSILASCAKSMTHGTKLLLVESVIRPDAPSFGKLADLEMLVMTGGRERTEEQYNELLRAAGFRPLRIIGTQSPADVVEAEKD